MNTHKTPIGKTDEWFTPRYIIESLGKFDLDPCSHDNRPFNTANEHYTKHNDGLSMPWAGRVWLNPPFNRQDRALFMRKMASHRAGVMLIPAACETAAFKQYVFASDFKAILMFDHRPHFLHQDGSRSMANCGGTICLVAYSDYDAEILANSDLGHLLTTQV